MRLDYFVVGPRLALRSSPSPSDYQHPTQQVWEFTILEPGPTTVGSALVEPRSHVVHIALRWRSPAQPGADRVEAMRLIAATCRKVTPTDLLLDCNLVEAAAHDQACAAGFEPQGPSIWRYPGRSTFAQVRKAGSVAECSSDPFLVPWNFEPRQWELLGPFLMEMRNTQMPILEIGCGFGRNAVLLEEWNLNTHGVDLSFEAVRQCRRWVRHPERFVTASVCRLPYADSSFDSILDIGCLHCAGAESLTDAIDEIARVLRPSGRLYSRFFKPRDHGWIEAQPYQTSSVGLETTAFTKLLDEQFVVTAWEQPDMTCVRAIRRPM